MTSAETVRVMIKGTDLGELGSINIESGVSLFTGEAFCSVIAEGTVNGKPVRLRGQLSPAEIQAHALTYLQAAEAAEADRAVKETFTKLGLPDEVWGLFISALREQRDKS